MSTSIGQWSDSMSLRCSTEVNFRLSPKMVHRHTVQPRALPFLPLLLVLQVNFDPEYGTVIKLACIMNSEKSFIDARLA